MKKKEPGRKAVQIVLDYDVRMALRLRRAETGEDVSAAVNRIMRLHMKASQKQEVSA